MTESSLSSTYPELLVLVADFLGLGRAVDELPSHERERVDGIIKAGLRQFYFPPPLQQGRPAHKWSFLFPIAELSTEAAKGDYNLPDDYAGLAGSITFEPPCGTRPLLVVGEGQIRHLRQTVERSGRPMSAAVRPKACDGSAGERYELLLWPTPDAVYKLGYAYKVLPNALSAAKPYPLGGMVHAETIIESCLAVAESRMDDEIGLHQAQWKERLAASIEEDRSREAPSLGYYGDRAGGAGDASRRTDGYYVTYDGVLPG